MTTHWLAASLTPGCAAAAATLPRQPQPELQEAAAHRRSASTGGLVTWLGREDGEPVVHLEGDLDVASGARLDTAIEQARTSGGRRVTVDATALRFVDLSGYRALMACIAPQAGADRIVLLLGAAITRLQALIALAGCRFDPDTVDLTNPAEPVFVPGRTHLSARRTGDRIPQVRS